MSFLLNRRSRSSSFASTSGNTFTATSRPSRVVQPEDNTLGTTLSVNLPLPPWRYKAELEGAQASKTQAELQLKAVQLQAETDVRDAYSRYQAAVQRLQLYRGGY